MTKQNSLQSDDDVKIDQALRAKVKAERTSLIDILRLLREADRRRIYSAFQLGSLNAYAVQELRYSEDEARRRVSAMRVLREVPEAESRLEIGTLNLTHLNLAQRVITVRKVNGEPLTSTEKADLLHEMDGTTTREAEKIAFKYAPDLRSRGVALHYDAIEDEDLREKLIRTANLYSHIEPHMTLIQLLNTLCDEKLAQHEPKTKKRDKTSTQPAAPRASTSKNPRHIPASISRAVWTRDRGKCINCRSSRFVEYEHIVPVAKGGTATFENLILLCRSCNQRSAIQQFGLAYMEKYLKPTAEKTKRPANNGSRGQRDPSH